MTRPDILRATSDQQPRFYESVANLPLGSKGKSEVHWTLKDRDNEGCDLTIEAIIPEGYELDPEAKDSSSVSLTSSEPLQTPLAMTIRKKSQKGAGPNQ